MDDISVYGSDAREHWLRLHKVLRRVDKSDMVWYGRRNVNSVVPRLNF